MSSRGRSNTDAKLNRIHHEILKTFENFSAPVTKLPITAYKPLRTSFPAGPVVSPIYLITLDHLLRDMLNIILTKCCHACQKLINCQDTFVNKQHVPTASSDF